MKPPVDARALDDRLRALRVVVVDVARSASDNYSGLNDNYETPTTR